MKQSSLPRALHLSAAALLCTGLVACDGGSSGAGAQPLERQGLWQREGYGTLYLVGDSGGAIYERTSTTCVLQARADNDDLADFFGGAELSSDGRRLTLAAASSGAFATTLSKADALPVACRDADLSAGTPTAVFEHFVQSYADYYAFFAERGVDWSGRVAAARGAVHDDMGDAALFELLSDLIEPLDDGHVQLAGNGAVYRPAALVGANKVVVDSFPAQSEYDDVQDYANALSARYWQNIGAKLDNGSARSFDGALPERLIWGTLDGGRIGYLYLASMAYLSPSEDGLDQWANARVMQEAMREVMRDLGDTQGLVIDLRANGGGHDTVGQVVAGHFVDQPGVYGRKHARSYLGDSAQVESTLQPRGERPYLNPVALITSEATASAAESFVLAMRARPQVTQVGEATNGILSDVLERTLPNGWEFWLANEVYYDHLNQVHEVDGIAPDVAAATFSLDAIAAGEDPAIDAAVTALGL